MGLLLGWLAWSGGPPQEVEELILGLLRHMSLLFVPAGVGVIVHLTVLGQSALAVIIAVFVSTTLTIIVTGLVMQVLGKRASRTRVAVLAASRVQPGQIQPDRLQR
jgi:holin-like protein